MKVSNLHYDVTEQGLKELFGKFDGLHSCEIIWDRQDRSTGESIITFDNPRSAEKALEALNGSDVDGQAIVLTMLK